MSEIFHMTNSEIAKLFRHVAASYSIKDEKKYRFQIIAYQKAADALEGISTEVKDLIKEEKLDTIPGIGSSMKQHIEELVVTGKSKHFESIMADIPEAMFPLLDVPSFGPKKAYKLVTHFQIKDPKQVLQIVKKLALEEKIAPLESFGQKSQADILRAIEEYEQGLTKSARMVLPFADEIAQRMVEYMKKSKAVKEIYPLGSLRRKKETIGDVDLAVASEDPETVIDHFVAYPHKDRVLEKGPVSAGLLVSGNKHIDLMVQPPDRFGSLLQHFTGSKNHNVHLRELAIKKGLSLSEKGIKEVKTEKMHTFETEEAFYKYLSMSWIPPEIREDTGEIELALKHDLPTLLEIKDIKGDFHLHSSFPVEESHDPGKDSMEDMVKHAIKLGYSYVGFSEHNPSVSQHTPEQTYKLIKSKADEVSRLNDKYKNSIRVFNLLETDIQPSGTLALDDKSAELLDGTLVSIHSVFSMDKDTMTKRVLKGLSHPKAKILTHPTGRLLNQRAGYDLHWDEIFTFAVQHNKALEINAFPSRLDLSDMLVRKAIEAGVKLVINTDSHASEQMTLMQYGVFVARRGWATKHDILNTMGYNEIEKWFK